MQISIVAFTGESGGALRPLADLCLLSPATQTNYIQETHIVCGHILCDLTEQALFPK